MALAVSTFKFVFTLILLSEVSMCPILSNTCHRPRRSTESLFVLKLHYTRYRACARRVSIIGVTRGSVSADFVTLYGISRLPATHNFGPNRIEVKINKNINQFKIFIGSE